jgi:integrase
LRQKRSDAGRDAKGPRATSKRFRREQAIGFKERLAETSGQRTGEPLSHSTQARTLAALKEFFKWLSKAKAAKLRDFPSLEQIRAVITAMRSKTVIDRRNCVLIAFAILTGMRDRAIVSLSLRDVDMTKTPPLVPQEPDRVETKFSKSINT